MKPSFLLGWQQKAYFQWQTVGFSEGMEGMCFKHVDAPVSLSGGEGKSHTRWAPASHK